MSDAPFRRLLALTLIGLVFVMTSCGADLNYTPPFGLVTLSIGTDGISVHVSSPELETPIGTFTVSITGGTSDANNQQSPDTGFLLIIRYYKLGTLVDEVYQINSGDSKVVVSADGHITFSVEQHRTFIDASKGNIQVIEVKDAGSAGASDTPVATIETPTPTPTPMPTPTPKPTPKPKPCPWISGVYTGSFGNTHIRISFDAVDDKGECTGQFTVGSSSQVSCHFSFTISGSTIQLTVTPDNGSLPSMSFSGTIKDGSISGTYSIPSKGQKGTWKISPS